MSNHNDLKGKQENAWIGNLLKEGTINLLLPVLKLIDYDEELFALRAQMGKSISAPPPGLRDSVRCHIFTNP